MTQFCFNGGIISICIGGPGLPGGVPQPVPGAVGLTPVVSGEAGTVQSDQSNPGFWFEIPLSRFYFNPVVIVGPVPTTDGDPAFPRVREVRTSSFQMKIDEWSNDDGVVSPVSVGYVVVEAGAWFLPNGKFITAGVSQLDHQWRAQSFTHVFPSVPVVMTQIDTERDSDPAVPRQRNVTDIGYEVMLQEGPGTDGVRGPERVSWLAMEEGVHAGFGTSLVVDQTLPVFSPFDFTLVSGIGVFEPIVLAALQTASIANPTSVRTETTVNTIFGSIEQGVADGDAPQSGFERIGFSLMVPGQIWIAQEHQVHLLP